jgi:hypothetical protein
MIRLLSSVCVASLGLGFAVASLSQAAGNPPSTAKLSKMKGPAQRFRLGMDLKSAEAVLKHHDVKYTSKAQDDPVPGKSLVIEGKYGFGGVEVVLDFVDGTLWNIKLRRSAGLCEQNTVDLGPPLRQKDGCRFWFDKKQLFSAFFCPASAAHGEGAECRLVSFQALERAGLSRDLLERELKGLEPPGP